MVRNDRVIVFCTAFMGIFTPYVLCLWVAIIPIPPYEVGSSVSFLSPRGIGIRKKGGSFFALLVVSFSLCSFWHPELEPNFVRDLTSWQVGSFAPDPPWG